MVKLLVHIPNLPNDINDTCKICSLLRSFQEFYPITQFGSINISIVLYFCRKPNTMNNAKIRVIIFDDNVTLGQSLVEIINDSDTCIAVQHFNRTENAIENIIMTEPDVVIMDINMPEENGIEATKRIKSEYPKIQILMQTVFDDDKNIFDAIAAGASGYILKDVSFSHLIQSIIDIHNGGSAMSPYIAKKVMNYLQQQKIEESNFKLSMREKEVLELLVYGLPYKQIADKMDITYDTVRAHMKKIYEKLHVSSMTEAVVKALKYKLF